MAIHATIKTHGSESCDQETTKCMPTIKRHVATTVNYLYIGMVSQYVTGSRKTGFIRRIDVLPRTQSYINKLSKIVPPKSAMT